MSVLNEKELKTLYLFFKKDYYLKVAEELAELQVAALHFRDNKATEDELVEEMADVLIQLDKLGVFIDKKKLQSVYEKKSRDLKDFINQLDNSYLNHRRVED